MYNKHNWLQKYQKIRISQVNKSRTALPPFFKNSFIPLTQDAPCGGRCLLTQIYVRNTVENSRETKENDVNNMVSLTINI